MSPIDPFNLARTNRNMKLAIDYFPRVGGRLAVNFFKERFRAGGWYDRGFQPWAPRSPRAKRHKNRKLLVDTGRLRRSIRLTRTAGTTVFIGSDVPYAKAHNEGLHTIVQVKEHKRGRYRKYKQETGQLTKTGRKQIRTVTRKLSEVTVKTHYRRMNIEKRQFIGDSQYLRKLLSRKLQTEITKAFK